MRTEPANSGGGGAMVYSQPVVLSSKSQQDVEAAFAIAQLSEEKPREPTTLTNGAPSSPPRFSHLRTAVMPYAYSRVERAAAKRKLDSRDDRPYAYKVARLQAVSDPVQTAIKCERDSFVTARRHQFPPRTDSTDDTELVGRFVRTCAPSKEDVRRQLYVTVSDPTVSPTLVSSVPSVLTTSGSSQIALQDKKPPVLSPAAAAERSYAVPSISQHQRRTVYHENDAVHPWEARRTNASKHAVVLPQQRHHVSLPSTSLLVPVSYDESAAKLQQGRGAFKYEASAGRRGERLSSSLVNAYYSLGQMAAAAAASQLPQSHHNGRAQLTRVCQSQRPPARVDGRTMDKVRRGEFGALSTLRRYCAQLRRHSAPPTDVDNNVAMDLSVRKQTSPIDAEPRSEVEVAAWCDRTSRSCGNSPGLREGEAPARRWTLGQLVQRSAAVRHQMNSLSLPSSPYAGDGHLSLMRPRRHACHDSASATASCAATAASADDVIERTGDEVTEASDVIPDSQLPLKKRRLHQLPSITEDSCAEQWTSETAVHEASSSSASAAAADREGKGSDAEPVQCSRSVFLQRDEDGDLPLHIAVAKGTAAAVDSIVAVMLSLGVGLDCCNNHHQTALHLAVLTDQADIVGRLLECGASSDVVDARGQTCVHVAVLLGTTSCLRQLLKQSRHPVNINAISCDGVTALHLAVQRGNTDAVRCLLSAGADVDRVDTKYGRTALHYAVQRGDMATTELLLSYGANRALVSRSGCTTPTVQSTYSSKCSTDILQRFHQPAVTYHHMPACCPTG